MNTGFQGCSASALLIMSVNAALSQSVQGIVNDDDQFSDCVNFAARNFTAFTYNNTSSNHAFGGGVSVSISSSLMSFLPPFSFLKRQLQRAS